MCHSDLVVESSLKSSFPGHYSLSKSDFDGLFREAAIVCDANVLLNLYRYSPETKRDLLRVIHGFRERLWLPYQAATEFFRNRCEVIATESGQYSAAKTQASKLIEQLEKTRGHPYVTPETLQQVKEALHKLSEELDSFRATHENLLAKDDTLEQLDALYRGRLGTEPTIDEMKAQMTESERRTAARTPPGYMDAHKEGARAQGDGVLWLQILEYAEQSQVPVILVTDDLKEDWWVKVNGRKLGPRPELTLEFKKRTGRGFHMYEPGQFIRFGSQYLGETVSDRTVKEAQALSRTHGGRYRRGLDELLRHMQRHKNAIDELLEEYGVAFRRGGPGNVVRVRCARLLAVHVERTPCLAEIIRAAFRYGESLDSFPPVSPAREATVRQLRDLFDVVPFLLPLLEEGGSGLGLQKSESTDQQIMRIKKLRPLRNAKRSVID